MFVLLPKSNEFLRDVRLGFGMMAKQGVGPENTRTQGSAANENELFYKAMD